MVAHLAYREKEYIWEALLVTYNMYLHQGFQITGISGDQEFSALNHLTTVLPTAPCLDWLAASQQGDFKMVPFGTLYPGCTLKNTYRKMISSDLKLLIIYKPIGPTARKSVQGRLLYHL
jgi:hypothetical protein